MGQKVDVEGFELSFILQSTECQTYQLKFWDQEKAVLWVSNPSTQLSWKRIFFTPLLFLSGSLIQLFKALSVLWSSWSPLSGLEAPWANKPQFLYLLSLAQCLGQNRHPHVVELTDLSNSTHTKKIPSYPPFKSLSPSLTVLCYLSACYTNSLESMTAAGCEINVHFTIQTTEGLILTV